RTFIDFGKAAFGQLKLTLTSSKMYDTVEVHLGERLDVAGNVDRMPTGTIRYRKFKIPLRQGQHTYQIVINPDKRNTGPAAIRMPEYVGEVLPFRYCEIEGYNDALRPENVVRTTVYYPFNDYAAEFHSSDSILNQIWDLCKYSIKATSFAGIYVDGDRERIPYEADAYINQLSHYTVDKEFSLARN